MHLRRIGAIASAILALSHAGLSAAPSKSTVFCRVVTAEGARYARAEGGQLHLLDNAPWAGGRETGRQVMRDGAVLLPPSEPRTILGLAGAYADRAGNPPVTSRWFAKSASATATDGDTVTVPSVLSSLKVESELVLVIGRRVKEATVAEAGGAIFGYATGTEIFGTVEEYHKVTGESSGRTEQMLAAGLKLGDKFAPFGPCIHAGVDWQGRDRTLSIRNAAGEERITYRHNTSALLYPPERIVSELSKIMTLEPGDLVFTGTTEAFVVHPGETVVSSVEGLGTVTNRIAR